MEIDGFVYDDATHTYTFNGKKVPSVTKVLDNIDPDLRYNQNFIRKTRIGTEVHATCDLINKGVEVDMESIPEANIGYVKGYLSFLDDSRFTVIHSERKVFSKKYGYAGTLDIFGRTNDGKHTYLDIKTTSRMPATVGLQLAGYANADMEMAGNVGGLIPHRMCVQLLPEGGYVVKHMPSEEYAYDLYIFICKLKGLQWDIENGIK